jgi:hypothetical protein
VRLEGLCLIRPTSSQSSILRVVADGKPKSHRDVLKATNLTPSGVWQALRRAWESDLILRTKKPLYESERLFKGRAGIRRNMRAYHLYLLKPKRVDRLQLQGHEYVSYSKRYLDVRGGGARSKARVILEFLKNNSQRAFYSTQIASALKDEGVRAADVMSNARRWEKRGLVYVRGYRTEDRQTPFKEGYLLTWIDQNKDRDQALKEAVDRTSKALVKQSSTSPIIERVHRIRDMIIEASKLQDLVGFDYIQTKLECSDAQAEEAVRRALQLYADLKEVKVFDAYRYFYHASLDERDLKAAVGFKENYVRVTKGRANRIGHNWEACVEWFVDKFTTGAHFQMQNHRGNGMDSRRITLHLIKPVGDRRANAEVDRVWMITPGPFAPPTTYVLECKWGVVTKRDVDDFFNVLRWSKEFGVDTPDGRQVQQGLVGVFAGSAFNPTENVQLKGGKTISLASYASRMNIQLLKASDFNQKLREHGCGQEVSAQKICRTARDENDVRQLLEGIWAGPTDAEKLLTEVAQKNRDVYDFETKLRGYALP